VQAGPNETTPLAFANAAMRFALELCALAALAYWGFTREHGGLRFLVGIGAPVLVIVVWGTFVSPNAPLRTQGLLRLTLVVVVFGWAVAALASAGQTLLAVLLGIAAAVNTALLHVLKQD
jgi:hypothetical protein